MPIPLDYEILRLIWWGLLGVLLIGLMVMDGFDYGVATLMPFICKNDNEKRILINTIGPVWEGNQVWLILGGGAIFAAWPLLYAVSFSGFYLAMFVILASLILRPVGFKFRSKVDNTLWRHAFDGCLFLGGLIPALLFGVAVGNGLQGVPFHFDDTMHPFYTGTFFQLLNPFALLCGLISLVMCLRHGCSYLILKTQGTLLARIKTWFIVFTVINLLLLGAAWYGITHHVKAYEFLSVVDPVGPSNPLFKNVIISQNGWNMTFHHYPWMWIGSFLTLAGLFLAPFFTFMKRPGIGFIMSGLNIAGTVALPGLLMFPFLLPSSTHPSHSLTVWDTSSSQMTLFIMLIAAVIFVPIILAYTSWAYKIFKGPLNETDMKKKEMY